MKATIQDACLGLILLVAPAGAVECVAVDGPAVQVSALVPFVNQVQTSQLDRVLTSTPDPGTRRWITAAEMSQWGLFPRESLQTPGVCVERRLRPLQAEEVVREAQAVLLQSHGKVRLADITSISPLLAPEGHLKLPPTGFQFITASGNFCSFLWRGAIEFDSHRSVPVRILGRYQTERIYFVAKRDLQEGDVLGASDYEKIAEPGCSRGAEPQLPSPEGFIMRRALRQGDKVQASTLSAPTVVDEGGALRVTASAGGALVSIEAIAEKPGRRGERVFVRNKESGKLIKVVLTGKGEASAAVGGATR